MPKRGGVPAVCMSLDEDCLRGCIIALERRLKLLQISYDSAIQKRSYGLKSTVKSIKKAEKELKEKKAALRDLGEE